MVKLVPNQGLTDTLITAKIEKKHNLKKITSQNNKKVKKQTITRIIDLAPDSETEPENFHISNDEDENDDFEDSQTGIEIGEFIQIKFSTKSKLMHYIGCVMKVHEDDFL